MPKSPWSDVSDEERMRMYIRVHNGQTTVQYEADQLGMPVGNLRRRLREVGQDYLEYTQDEEDDDSTHVHVDEDTKVHINGSDPNNMVISTASQIITSLEELLDFLKVDLDVWVVDHWIGNAWPTTFKNAKKNLTIQDGKISGTIQQDGAASAQNIQVKAWLVRKQPVEVRPVVKPVSFKYSPVAVSNKKALTGKGFEHTLVIPDIHFGFDRAQRRNELVPYHDRRALSIVLSVAKEYAFDNIILLGDLFDFADFSTKFFSGPEAYYNIQPAIAEASWFLTQLRGFNPNAEIVLIEGNHDERLPRIMREQLRGAMSLTPGMKVAKNPLFSVPGLLELDKLGVTWVGGYPNSRYFLEENLALEHGNRASVPGATAPKVLENGNYSVIFGHIHRMEMSTRTIYKRGGHRVIYGFCPGFLGRLDGALPARTDQNTWSQGFATVIHNQAQHSIRPIFIDNGVTIFDDQLFSGFDYIDALNESTEEQFAY